MPKHVDVHAALTLGYVHLPFVTAPVGLDGKEEGSMESCVVGRHHYVLLNDIEQGDPASLDQTGSQRLTLTGCRRGPLCDHEKYQ